MNETVDLARLELLEYLNLTEEEAAHAVNPFAKRTAAEMAEPHMFVLRLMRSPENVYYTCKHVLNVELHPFQCVTLHELLTRRFPMLLGTRGFSKSFLLAIAALLKALWWQGSKVVICGSGFRQSKTVFNYAERIWNNAPVLRSLVAENSSSGPRHDSDRWTLILGDSTVTALPVGDGSRIRGERANMIIMDEFSSIPRDIFEVVIAGFGVVSMSPIQQAKREARIRVLDRLGALSTPELMDEVRRNDQGNQIILSGTAYYQFNHFYDYWKRWKGIVESKGDPELLRKACSGEFDPDLDWRDYSIIRVPVELLPTGYMDARQVARSRASVATNIYSMEFGSCFAGDSNGFFRRSLIESCCTSQDQPIMPVGGTCPVWFNASLRGSPLHTYIMGVDPAAQNDNFAIVILEVHGDHRRIVYCWTTDKKRYREKVEGRFVEEKDYYGYCARKIRELLKVFPCEVISLDAQGGGENGVLEALHDPDKLQIGEQPIWPVTRDHPLSDGKERPDDDQPGRHIVELVQFARSEYTAGANHGMKKDFEDRTLLFPQRDAITLSEAFVQDNLSHRIFDTLEECVDEIEDLKDELSTITYSQTPGSMRDRWDTPELKLPGSKKGRLRKDRYSALLMANYAARRLHRQLEMPILPSYGGFVDQIEIGEHDRDDFVAYAPDWYQKASGEGIYEEFGFSDHIA